MAEQIKRSLEQILNEMFEDEKKTKKNGEIVREESALKKYTKVRWVQYELGLYMRYSLPLNEVNGSAVVYFSKRFLRGESAYCAYHSELKEAYKRLGYAVDACKKRCTDLVVELNEALSDLGLDKIEDIQKFLDILTYSPIIRKNSEGNPVMEKPYNFLVVGHWANSENFRDFVKEIRLLLKDKKMISMQNIYKNICDTRMSKTYKNKVATRRKNAINL